MGLVFTSSIVKGRPPYHPLLGRHPFPCLWRKTVVGDIVVVVKGRQHSYFVIKSISMSSTTAPITIPVPGANVFPFFMHML